MRKINFLLLVLLSGSITYSQREWTWIGGAKNPDVARFYGIRGLPGPANNPGSRIGAAYWTDQQGNFWLFGGRGNNVDGGLLNDLWTYNPRSNTWTWMGGSINEYGRGSYGELGQPSPGNIPGARQNAVFWTDNNGNFWLFGGRGIPPRQRDDDDDDDDDEIENNGLLNDLWMYSVESRRWTFVNGNDRQNESGRYGNRNEPSSSNRPGARYSASGWTDENGDLWLFGGRGFTAGDGMRLLDDVWKYSPSENSWTWISGSESGNVNVSYGERGQFALSNTPGGRHGCISWSDNQGNFYLFGGGTLTDLFADLWRFDVTRQQWAWISGSNDPNTAPQLAGPGVPETNVHPGARTLSAVWVDAAGDTWLFGGNGYGGETGSNPLNSLWKYSLASNAWTLEKGTISTDPAPVYGSRGDPDADNTPGGTASPAFWEDEDGNFWFFGGRSKAGYLNQVWKLSPACGAAGGATISPASAVLCGNASQVLTVSGGTSYEWSRDGVVIAGETQATITVTEPGTYTVVVKNGNCSAPAANSATITRGTAPQGGISPAAASICEGSSQVLRAEGGTSYEWLRDGSVIEGATSDTLLVNLPGVYSIVIKNEGCTAAGSNTAVVTFGEVSGVRYPDVTATPNVPIRLSARTENAKYQWSPATGLDDPTSATPVATIAQDIQYTVEIKPADGCSAIDTVLVRVMNSDRKVFVPTAFTPNSNNMNDRLRPLGGLNRLDYFRVYNRWGNKVFETNQAGAGWDGRFNGVPQPEDTYTWVLSGTLADGSSVRLSGKTLLIR